MCLRVSVTAAAAVALCVCVCMCIPYLIHYQQVGDWAIDSHQIQTWGRTVKPAESTREAAQSAVSNIESKDPLHFFFAPDLSSSVGLSQL